MLSRRSIVAGLLLGFVVRPAVGRDGMKGRTNALVAAEGRRFDQAFFALLAAASRKKNFAYSPYSVGAALDLLTLGADGDTLRVLTSTRHVDIETMVRRPSVPQLVSSVSSNDLILRLASSIWLKPGARPRPAFSIAAKAIFAAEIRNVDFEKTSTIEAINAWGKESTGGLISGLVNSLDPETEFVIGNTAYFKGRWAFPFDKAKTSTGPFSTIDGGSRQAELMRAQVRAPYLESDDWHAIALPYKGEKLEMVIVTAKLPKNSAAVRRKVLSAGFLSTIEAQAFSDRSASVVCPRFKVEFGADLTPYMSKLGLKTVFSGPANFSQMTASRINDISIVHRAIVDVNEEGTEAAAATTVIASREATPVPQVEFVADRPFAFLIRDRASGTVFFQGFVQDPSA